MPPKVKVEDVIETLLDQRVIDAICKSLMPMIALTVEEAMDKKLRSILRDIAALKKENVSHRLEIGKLQASVADLQNSERGHKAKLEALEAYQRSDNVVIRGLPESTYAEAGCPSAGSDIASTDRGETSVAAEATFLRFCNDRLHIQLKPEDISTVHRLPRGNKDKVRPLVVRFASRRSRDAVLRAKKVLHTKPGDRIFVSEQLTKAASNMFFEARKLVREKKLHAAWTINGRIHIKKTSNPSERPTVVQSLEELSK